MRDGAMGLDRSWVFPIETAPGRARNSVVECFLHTEEVRGSNPFAPTTPAFGGRFRFVQDNNDRVEPLTPSSRGS